MSFSDTYGSLTAKLQELSERSYLKGVFIVFKMLCFS